MPSSNYILYNMGFPPSTIKEMTGESTEPETQRAGPEDLKQKVAGLEATIVKHEELIVELQRQINEVTSYIQQNTIGQNGSYKPSYWEPR